MGKQRATTDGNEKPLNEQEREIARLYMTGATMREIQAAVGLDYTYCSRILKRPHVAEWIEDARRDADAALKRRFVAAGPEAFGVLVEIMRKDEAPEAARIAAAKEVLARLAPTRTAIEGGETPVRVAVTTPEELRRMSDDELRAALERVEG